jgi:arsenite methyltransferase
LVEAGKVFPCAATPFRMLAASRLAPHFSCISDFSRNYGLFEDVGRAAFRYVISFQ